MSWDSYVDNLIGHTNSGGSNHADKAGIFGIDGGAAWTTVCGGKGIVPHGQEMVNIARCFKNKDFNPFMAGGIHLEGTKYQFLRVEDEKLVLGKKKEHGAVTMQASKTAIVVAHTAEGSQQGVVNKGVSIITEYLESLGM